MDVLRFANDVQVITYSVIGALGTYSAYMAVNMALGRKQTVKDLLRHTYTIGETGTGKSVKCRNDILDCIKKGYGCLYIDIHGNDAVELLNCIPPKHKDRVIYLDPAKYIIGFSIFNDVKNDMQNELSVDALISIFDVLWPNFIGPSTEDTLRMASLGVVPQKVSTLLEIYLMLTDDNFRESLEIKDDAVREFWKVTFPETIKRDKSRLNPPTNKLRKLIMSKICRLTLCQLAPKFSFEKAMQDNKIIICNFAKGKIGHDTAKLLSALMVCKLQLSLFKRNENSTPFFCFLDEFQNYVTKSFDEILSESRKYNISLNLYHQYFHQIPEYLQHAIRGNVGSIYTFRVNDDAEMIAKMFDIEANDIKTLDNYYCYCKRLVNGKKEETRMVKSVPPPKKYGCARDIMNHSQAEYSTHEVIIQRDIKGRLKAPCSVEEVLEEEIC